jgi:hypothetical protein
VLIGDAQRIYRTATSALGPTVVTLSPIDGSSCENDLAPVNPKGIHLRRRVEVTVLPHERLRLVSSSAIINDRMQL